jgi:outer membrane immunogenic protein
MGKNMKQFFLRLACSMAALLPASSVLAADLVEDLRPATYDWSGPYAGVFIGGITQTGTYDTTCALCAVGTRELNGYGWNGGVLAGWNYQIDTFVMGIEGDWAFGGNVADNNSPAELTHMDFNNIATLRARAGMAFDNTLFYATGGFAAVDTKFSTDDYAGAASDDSKWLNGWVIGGGIEHAFSDSLTARLEYTYMSVSDETYTFVNGANTLDVQNSFDGIYQIRAGMTYNFGW